MGKLRNLLDGIPSRHLPPNTPQQPGSLRLVLGSSQSGKSFFVKNLLAQLPSTQRLLISDPNDEYAHRWTPKRKALDVDRYESFFDFWTLRKEGKGRDRATFASHRGDELDPLLAYAWCVSQCVIVLDEFHKATSGGSCSPTLEDSIARGRHRGNHLVCVTQNPQFVPTRVFQNAHEITVFRINEGNARAKLIAEYGDRADLERVGDLDVGESITISNR